MTTTPKKTDRVCGECRSPFRKAEGVWAWLGNHTALVCRKCGRDHELHRAIEAERELRDEKRALVQKLFDAAVELAIEWQKNVNDRIKAGRVYGTVDCIAIANGQDRDRLMVNVWQTAEERITKRKAATKLPAKIVLQMLKKAVRA